MKFSHKTFYGMTEMGKTAAMKKIAAVLRKNKQKIIAYSGVGDLAWPGKVTASVHELEDLLEDPKSAYAHVFLDEARVLYSRFKRLKHPHIDNLFTMGRHKGFTVYCATQYPTSIPPAARVNCSECYCFRLGSADHAKIVYEDFGDMRFEGRRISGLILKLPQLEFFHLIKPDTARHKRVTF